MLRRKTMKKRSIIALLAALALTCTAVGFTACGTTSASKTVAVIAKGETHAFWKAVKSGAEKAGTERGYTITFQGPANESSDEVPNQKKMVETAVSKNPAALVLATIGTGFTDALESAYSKNIPVVSFDSGIFAEDIATLNKDSKNPIKSHVATSNVEAAAIAGQKLFEAIKTDIAAATTSAKYVVGIIQHDNTQTGVDRAKGFTDKFKALADADATTAGKYTIEKEVKDGDANEAYVQALSALNTKGAKAIFMTNEGVVNQVQPKATDYANIKFVGFDAGSKQISWIKAKTNLIGSVAQDSVDMGYKATLRAIDAAEGKSVDASYAISGAWYDSTNIEQMIKDNLVYEG